MNSVVKTDEEQEHTMPAARISTNKWDIDELVSSSPNFFHIPRFPISADELSITLADHEAKGIPLVVSDIHEHPEWSSGKFTLGYFARHSPPSQLTYYHSLELTR